MEAQKAKQPNPDDKRKRADLDKRYGKMRYVYSDQEPLRRVNRCATTTEWIKDNASFV